MDKLRHPKIYDVIYPPKSTTASVQNKTILPFLPPSLPLRPSPLRRRCPPSTPTSSSATGSPNPLTLTLSSFPTTSSPPPPPFASISSSNFPSNPSKDPKSPSAPPFDYSAWVDRYFWERVNLPDYRHTPEVERILNEHHLLEAQPDATSEEISANEKWWNDFRSHPFIKFIRRAEEISDQINEQELMENHDPYRREDRDYWRVIPHVTGLDGRPMPRKSRKTRQESDDKFWDFMKQFQFGLWGFGKRPYPPGRPINVAQDIGYKRLEKRYYHFIMKSDGFFYNDRLGHTRGLMELIQLWTAWGCWNNR